MFEEMTPIFTEKALTPYDICELDGKNLKIFVGEDVVDGERTTVVLGSDIVSGVQYVLGVRKTEEKESVTTDGRELDMSDEEVFKIASGVDTCPVHPFWLKDDITLGSVRGAVLRFARAIEAEVRSKQCVQKPKPTKEWSYCPECGSEYVRHHEGEHKQCANCHQEWFSDIDYTDVVRKHLSSKFSFKDAEQQTTPDEFYIEFETLRKALCMMGIAAPESDSKLGVNMQSYAKQIIKSVAKKYPQPAHDSAAVRLDKQCREAVAASLGFIHGGDYAWSYLLQQIKDIVSAAESQQHTPDVSALVEALETTCEYLPIGSRELEMASIALAQHRKGGEK